jgi:hypothetical protein
MKVSLDHAQKRYARDRIGITLGGKDLADPQYISGLYREPVTDSIIRRPRCTEDSWQTSEASPYDKITLAGFGSPAGFKEMYPVAGWRRIIGPAGTFLTTTTTYAANTPFYVSYYSYGVGGDGIACEFGWSDTPGVANDIAFRCYLSGRVEAWKGGLIIGQGSISGSRFHDRATNHEYVEMLILPARLKEILIWSLAGNGFRAIIPDIDEDETSPVIIPSSKFWIRTIDISCNIMVAPMKFATSGTCASELFNLAEAPDSLDVLEQFDNASWAGGAAEDFRIYGQAAYRTGATDAVSASLVAADGTTAFTPDGTARDVRIKLTMTGHAESTAQVFGAQIAFSGLAAETDDSEEADITDFVLGGTLSVPDVGPAQVSFAITNPQDLSGTVSGLTEQYNRPLKVEIGTTKIFDGRTDPVAWNRLYSADAEQIMITASDNTKALQKYMVRERIPFDGMLFCHATSPCFVRFWLELIGFDSADLALETATVTVGDIAPERCGDWAQVADIGASAWDQLSKAMQDYLGGWWFGWVPTASGLKFTVKSATTMAAESPVLDLYFTTAAAIAGGVSAANAWKYVYRSLERTVIESEANEINLTGFDPRKRLPIGARKVDNASQDPTLAPSARPAGWHGEPARVGLINAGLSSKQILSDATDLLAARLFQDREVVSFECEFLMADEAAGVPVWTGQKVRLKDALGTGVHITTTIQTIEASFIKDPNGSDTWQWRPAQYVGSNVNSLSGGVSYQELRSWAKANVSRGVIQRRNSQGISLDRFESLEVV